MPCQMINGEVRCRLTVIVENLKQTMAAALHLIEITKPPSKTAVVMNKNEFLFFKNVVEYSYETMKKISSDINAALQSKRSYKHSALIDKVITFHRANDNSLYLEINAICAEVFFLI